MGSVPKCDFAILDSITNFPRHPISDDLLQIILWGLRRLGVKDVPTLQAFRKFQAFLRESETFNKSRAYVSVLGNHFTSNSILQSARLDMSNLMVRRRLSFYPERCSHGTSELRHCVKWLYTLPDCKLTPMWEATPGKHFYVGELARERDGSYVLPLRWFLWDGVMHMVYYPVLMTEGGLEVDPTSRLERSAEGLSLTLPVILRDEPELRVAAETRATFNPMALNPWRIRADGRPCFKYFILFGGDDVSGNRSKSWNKHNCYYYCAVGLPLECLNQEYFVHFISSSQYAGPLEQVAAISEQLRSVKDTGIVCYDALAVEQDRAQTECLLLLDLFVGTGDGPWQSELSSHSGDCCPCRFCSMGGNIKERSSDEGFLAIMQAGLPRRPGTTSAQIRKDLETSTHPRQGTALGNTQQATGTVDALAQTVIEALVERGKNMFDEKTANGVRVHTNAQIHSSLQEEQARMLARGDFINSLLNDEVFDPHQDTALGRLHLVLLGFTKYFWSASLPPSGRKLSVAEKATLDRAEATLLSLSQAGLGDRSVRADYVMRYRGSLVGRHLHSIAQLGVFIFGRTADTVLLEIWITLGRHLMLAG
ncbi:hypothetical protein C8T65DRAFT_810964 [Cerioporus squamosus]|nr:hypothetical protein C8T65DRAFT_810964 [Cerioporus squamosus]